jgi:electron transfer flavoprotein alpha subunit
MHVSGWHQGLRVIVANKEDKEAPIFQIADRHRAPVLVA